MEATRKTQLRAVAQAMDIDGDGFFSKDELRVWLKGCMVAAAPSSQGLISDEELTMMADDMLPIAMNMLLEGVDTNHDGKVRWPLRGHAALADSGCVVGRSAWKST